MRAGVSLCVWERFGSDCKARTTGSEPPGQRSLYQACPSHHALVLPSRSLPSSQNALQK
jgi:hypothetical protein